MFVQCLNLPNVELLAAFGQIVLDIFKGINDAPNIFDLLTATVNIILLIEKCIP